MRRPSKRPLEIVPQVDKSLSVDNATRAANQISFFNRPDPQVLAECKVIVARDNQFQNYMVENARREMGLTPVDQTQRTGPRRQIRNRVQNMQNEAAAAGLGALTGQIAGQFGLQSAATAAAGLLGPLGLTGVAGYVGSIGAAGTAAPIIAGSLGAMAAAHGAKRAYRWYTGNEA